MTEQRPRIALPADEGEAKPTWRDELEALRIVLEALMPLPPDMQQRVLASVLCVLDGDSAVQVLQRWKAARPPRSGLRA